MKVEVGNGYYFMYIAIALVYAIALLLILKGKSKKTIKIVLSILLFLNFALHFIKQFFSPYRENYPTSLRRSTGENICAVSTLLFPFIFVFSKKENVLTDYMFFIGLCGGFGALFYPTEALGKDPFVFDVLRFYFCHITLVVIPLVSAILGLFRPRIKTFWAIPLLFLVHEGLICLNEIILVKTNMIEGPISKLLDANYRNNSFVFGINQTMPWSKKIFDPLVPKFFKTDAFHINGGKDFYFPVLWLTGPAFVFLTPIYLIFTFPFALADHIKNKRLKQQNNF